MGAVKNVIEPVAIALTFTAGTLINRRRGIRDDEREVRAPLLERAASPPPPARPCYPDNSRFRNNLTSRFLAYFPFLIEIWYWNLTYWVYQLARALTATLIRDNAAVFDRARSHALAILSLESRLGLAIEQPLQHYILTRQEWLMPLLAKIYYSHIFLGVVFLVYVYTYLPPPRFRTIRRTFAANNALAFAILSVYRVMPPRLLPDEYGFVDVLHGSGSAWEHNRFQLTIAAMPSLHFGTSLFLCVCLMRFAPHRPLRLLAPLWPALMLLTIVGTANHFLLDAAVGAVIPALGWKLNRCLLVLGPLEEWAFWALRTEKPAAVRERGARRRRGSAGSVGSDGWKSPELLA